MADQITYICKKCNAVSTDPDVMPCHCSLHSAMDYVTGETKNELERLKAENERLREALTHICEQDEATARIQNLCNAALGGLDAD